MARARKREMTGESMLAQDYIITPLQHTEGRNRKTELEKSK
jgi:hypothetical protein